MANVKISELSELTQKATNDYIPIVDTSANETKKISVDNLMEGAGGGDATPIGTVQPFAGSTAPNGYLLCDGSAVSRDTYSDLFTIIGTTYGTGDGSTTFNLPNLKGRTVVMRDSSQTEFDTLGETGGEKNHTLTVDEMPSHRHGFEIPKMLYADVSSGSVLGGDTIVEQTTHYTGYEGGGQAHNNLQPYIVLNYVIKAFNTSTTPVQSQVVNAYSESTNNVYSCDYVNKFGKLLWSGFWTSGSITVNDSTNYSVFIVFILGTVACVGTRNYGGAVIGKYGTYSYEQYTYRVIGSGNTWTIDSENVGGSDGTQNVAITAIYGLF